MQSDVNCATGTATGSLYVGRARLRSILITSAITAGTVVLKNGGAGGTTVVTINTPAAIGMQQMLIPGEGVLFTTDIYLTLTTATSVTICYS